MASRQYYNSLKSMGDIISEVSEWSPADIGDTDLLSDYLTKLPTSFDDPYQYFLAFGALTLEEVRAQIGAGLDTLVTTSSLPVENAVLHCSHSAFTISVGFRAKDESYRSRPLRTCDVLLLTPDAKTGFPITTSKREVIGVVKETDDFEPDVNPIHWCKVHLHTSHEQGFKLALQTRSGRQLWGAALLTSIPVVRSLRRLVAGWEHGSCFPHFMSTIMGRHDQAASRTTGAPVRQEVLMNVLGEERNLNESQKNCIAEVLRRDGVHLIHGPPGTGKTTTLVTLLSCLFESDILTVQAAPTNIAVIEVAKRFLARIQSARNFRARNTLGDIVLIGDDERMDLDGLLDSIFLDRRVDRLEEVLKKWPTSLLDLERFLTEFPKVFHEAQHTPNETEPSKPVESAWEFFWRISSGHIIDIEKSIIIFLSDLPSSVLVTSTREELTKNLELVRKFSNYLEAYRSEYQETKDFAQSYSRRAISPKLLSSIDRLRESTAVVAGSTSCLSILSAESGKQLERRLLAGVRVIFSTVGCTGRRIMDPVLKNAHTVIVDEATQLPEAVTALLFRRTLSRLILAGDHKQLPATVISPLAKDNLYGRSLFERLKLSQHTSSFLLDIQYRMRPEISEFPTRVFYGGQLKDWEGLVEKQPMPWHIAVTAAGQRLFPPFAVIDLDSIEIKDPFGTSIYNETEADFIANYITHFANVLVPTHNMVVGIGVVTPYVAQVETIKKRLGNVADKADDGVFRISPGIEVEVKTVDGSQGQEKDVIIISLVRSNKYGEIGFVEDERRLNVALTRAKHSCFVIGNTRTLTRRNLIFNKLVAESKNRGVHLNFRDYPDLAKLTNNQSLATHHLKMNSTPSRDLQTSLMRNTLWKMNLTRNALDAIRTMSIGKTKEKVLGFLNALAEGYRPKNRNRFSVLTYQKVIESWVVAGDFAVVWGIALEAQEHSYIQIIQVYKIVSKTNINEAIKQVTLSLSRHSDDYLKAISQIEKEDVPSTDKQRIVPSTFARVPRILWHRPLEDNKDNDESGEDEVHDELTLSKKHRLTAEVARLILKNTIDEIELPISLSEDETSIVNENGSLFILGRSGTGKTTVMLMRMFQREQAYYIQMDSYERKPIQVMLTASSTLCADMNSYYYKLRKSIVRPEEQDQELQESGSRPLDNARLDDLPDTAFICFSDFLAILDRHLEKPFLLRNRRLMNLDNAIQEGDWDEQFEIGREVIQESRAYRTTTPDDGREVTFSRFRDVYWKHFDLYFQRKYDVSAIWMEFQSCIKGSLNSLLYPRGILPLDVFVELADSGSFTFNRDERNEIYRLFLKYETKKRGKRDWDVGDLTSHIFLELANTRYRGRIIDYIYVDEVQDLTPAQIAIFKYVCRDRCGFVFAGDTAQTISAGVGFRFQSVRDLFYYNILPYIDSTLTSVKTFIPSTHVLNQNYRTHTGVLNLASWVVEMLYQSFPSMVDKLPREKSLIPGRKPLFLEDTTMDEVLIHLFGMGKVRNEFDAEQTIIVIIVRDEIIKEEIALLVQEHNALVLTVYEAKGLEFENVLCYDFFADSPFEKWRVLWQPDLVDEKHQILCSELKALYVVITRCTKKLWFFDRERKKSQPALDIWQSQNLVKCVPAANQRRHWNKIPSLETNAEISWAERWKRFGTNLFEKRLYKDAGKCFARAQDHHNAELCEALVAETEGEIHADNGKMAESHQKYYDAAKIFEKIGEHRRAGAAYKAALKFDKAQKMFCILSEYDNVLDCCLRGKLYMKALIIFQSANVDKKVKEILGRRFAILCHSAQDTENMLNFLEYTGPEVRRSFLERYKYYNELLQSDTHTKRYERMAEVYERKGELFEAARCWKQHGDTVGQTRVLLRLAQPLFCFTLAGIQLDAVADLQKIRNLLRDIIGSDSAVSFELKFLVDMFDASPTDTSTWTRLLNEIQARKGVGCGGLELMAKFLVMQALWRDDCWQADPQTFIKALKSCRRELSVLNKNLADTILSERKYECYRVFGLEASRNPEYCLVDNTVLLTVRSSLGSRKVVSRTKFSQTEMKLSEFASLAQKFVVSTMEKAIRRGLQDLRQIAEFLKPCDTLLLDNGTTCNNSKCVRVHDDVRYLQEEKKRIRCQIDIVEFAADCKNLGDDFANEHKRCRAELLDMLNPDMPTHFDPLTILDFKKSPLVNIIFEEYKREVKEKELIDLRLAMTLLVSESTASLIWYEELNHSRDQDHRWALWQAFHWLRVHDKRKDPAMMSGRMGASALLTMAGYRTFNPIPSITLPPKLYIPILEKILTILVLRNGRFWATCLPARLLTNVICGEKSASFDYILHRKYRCGRYQICELKDMLCLLFRCNAEALMTWFRCNRISRVQCRGYLLRILSLVFVIYLNFKDYRVEIREILSQVNWNTIEFLGLLRERLQRLAVEKDENGQDYIAELVQSWKDEFLVLATRNLPPILQPLRRVRVSRNEPIKNTLLRHFTGLSAGPPVKSIRKNDHTPEVTNIPLDPNQIGDDDREEMAEESAVMEAAPVGEEIEVKLPPRIHSCIRQVLLSVRARIKRRNAIQNPRDRYVFVATEYFKRRDISSEFLSYYLKIVCELRADLVSSLEKVKRFLASPQKGDGELVDDLMTYKEASEEHLAKLDVNNTRFMGTNAQRSAEELVKAAERHQKGGRQLLHMI